MPEPAPLNDKPAMSMCMLLARAQMMYPTALTILAASRNHRRPNRSELAPVRRMVIVAPVVMHGIVQLESELDPNRTDSSAIMFDDVGVALRQDVRETPGKG